MMKKVWFIYPDTTPRDSNAFGWFGESFGKFGLETEFFFWDKCGESDCLSKKVLPDVVVMRGYNSRISRFFETEGVKVINSTSSMELCRDKVATGRVLEKCNIPTPKTFLYPMQYPEWKELSNDFNRKCIIMKLSMGSKGEEVFLLENEEDYRVAKDFCQSSELIKEGAVPMFQEYISTSRGRDIRVWVVGGEVAGHTLRYNPGSFKSNFAQGGGVKDIELDDKVAELAVNASRALGLEFAGVDILFGGGEWCEYLVCEVNGNAGFRTASLIGGIDIPAALAHYIAGLK